MELICTGCFVNPVAAHRSVEHDCAELMVCDLGAIALSPDLGAHAVLRCDYCGSAVHLDHRHLAWNDT